jgi:hypothetical protein
MSLLPPISPDNVLGEEQQLRTDPEPCRFCRFAIDFEADLISFQAKSDHSAGAQKIVRLSYGENWRVPKIRQQHGRALVLTVTNEEHVAAARVLGRLQMPDAKGPRPNLFALDCVFQLSAERVLSESAQEQRIAAVGRSVGGPLHKLSEMKKKRSLHAIFIYG